MVYVKIVLHAENPDFADIVVAGGVELNLSGVVIGLVRKMA